MVWRAILKFGWRKILSPTLGRTVPKRSRPFTKVVLNYREPGTLNSVPGKINIYFHELTKQNLNYIATRYRPDIDHENLVMRLNKSSFIAALSQISSFA